MTRVQQLAAQIVARVAAGRSLDRELEQARLRAADLTPQERGALQDLAYGTLRFLGEAEAVLEQLLEHEPRDEIVRHLLAVGIYQLVHTRAAPYAIVDHATEAAAGLGAGRAKGYVNAVLRTFLRGRDAVLDRAHATEKGRYSHPHWWVEKLRTGYPEDYERMLEISNARPPLTLRVNVRKTTTRAYAERLTQLGIAADVIRDCAVALRSPMPIDRVPGFAEGHVSVQDAAAQLAAVFLDATAGARVLDACAAPGGKTAHILERGNVDLTALDIDAQRLARVEANLARLELPARVVVGDAAEPDAWWNGTPFDYILADVPCSASGVVRRHPDIKWLRKSDDIKRFAERQRVILDALWRMLATGGKLLYVTCSVFHEENQNQIARFVERHSDAHRQPLPWPSNLKNIAGQIIPDEQHDGFFYALLQKI